MFISNQKAMAISLAFCFTLVLAFTSYSAYGKTEQKEIQVGLEPFPPLINEDGSGLVVEMLKAIDKKSPINFNFQIMTYARAKHELKNNRLSLIGLTPQYVETKEFYQYGQDIDWSIPAHVDFFSFANEHFSPEVIKKSSIGTLIGNADFFSEILSIPREQFVEVTSLQQLVKMVSLGRINYIVFERVSLMKTIERMNISGIYYHNATLLSASMAVANSPAGLQLKEQLDHLINEYGKSEVFDEYLGYSNLPASGVVNP